MEENENGLRSAMFDCEYETIDFYGESEWHYSSSDAEQQCDDEFDATRDSHVNDIESNGGFLISEITESIQVEIDTSSGEDLFKARREGSIEYGLCEEGLIKPSNIRFSNHSEIKRHLTNDVTFFSAEKRILSKIQKRHPRSSRIIGDTDYEIAEYIGISDIFSVEGEAIVEDANVNPIPQNTKIRHWVIDNCQSTTQTRRKDFRYKEVHGLKVHFGKKITSKKTTKANINFKFKGVGGGISHSIEHTISLDEQRTSNFTVSEEETYSFNLTVNPRKVLKATLIYEQANAFQPFSGVITFDGYAIKKFSQGRRAGGIYKTWTQLVPIQSLLGESARKLSVSGRIENINVGIIREKFREKDAECDKALWHSF